MSRPVQAKCVGNRLHGDQHAAFVAHRDEAVLVEGDDFGFHGGLLGGLGGEFFGIGFEAELDGDRVGFAVVRFSLAV